MSDSLRVQGPLSARGVLLWPLASPACCRKDITSAQTCVALTFAGVGCVTSALTQDISDLVAGATPTSGIAHPNYAGHRWYAARILDAIANPQRKARIHVESPEYGNDGWILGTQVRSVDEARDCSKLYSGPLGPYCSDDVVATATLPGLLNTPFSVGAIIDGVFDDCSASSGIVSGVSCFGQFSVSGQEQLVFSPGDGSHFIQIVPNPNPRTQVIESFELKVDLNDPLSEIYIDYAANPIHGNGGWYVSSVPLVLSSYDTGSGSGLQAVEYKIDNDPQVSQIVPPGQLFTFIHISIPNDGVHLVTLRSEDLAGRSSAAQQTIKIDSTGPVIYGATTTSPNAYGWYDHDVTVHFSATDATSGIAWVTPDTTIATEGTTERTQFVTGTATDKAGNAESATVGPFYIDKTPPTIVSPQENQNYILHEIVPVSVSCTDSLSGIALNPNTPTNVSPCSVETGGKGDPSSKCSKPNPLGIITLCLDTSTVGPHSYTVSAIDNAGNMNSTTIHYNVIYKFQWISSASGSSFQPNSQVIVRFRLVDAFGNSVNSTLPPKVWVDCPPTAALSSTFCVNGLTLPNPAKTANCHLPHSVGACSNNATYVRGTGEFTFKLSTFGLLSPTGDHYIWVTLDDRTAYWTKITIK